MEKVVIVDSNGLGWASYYTLGHLSNDEMRVGVIFGFLNQVLTIAEKFNTNKFIFSWDSRKNRRRILFPEYKIGRRKANDERTPEEIAELNMMFMQFDQLRTEILPFLGFSNIIRKTGFESDDVIANFIRQQNEEEMSIHVISSDEDLWQLIQRNVLQYAPKSGKTMVRSKFIKEWGIEPEQWGLVKAIAGCPSDEVPGIEKVGPKTAVKYLLGQLKETTKTFKAIEAGKDIIERNKPLVILPFEEFEVPFNRDDKFQIKRFRYIFKKFNFQSNLKPDKLNRWEEAFCK